MSIIDGTGKSRALEFDERVQPSRTALVLIDVQKDFCDPEGICARIGEDLSAMPPMLERISELLAAARAAGNLIVFVRASYDPPVVSPALGELYDRRQFKPGICLEGTPGIEFMPGTEPREGAPNEIVVTKHRFSAWWGTDLDLILRSNGVKSVVLTGVVSEGCVESTARDAFFKDYYVVVAEDAAGGYSRARHDAAMEIIGKSFGRVVPSAQVAASWLKAPAGARGWQPEEKKQALLTRLPQRLDPAHTAIIMIDVQNDLCVEGGAFTRRGHGIGNIRKALRPMLDLLDAGRAAGCLMIHVKSEYSPLIRHVGSPYRHPAANAEGSTATLSSAQFAPGEVLDPAYAEACQPNTWGGDFVEGFGPRGDELLLVKHRISAFIDTRLELLLRSNGIRSVVIGGVTTNCCVETATRNACMLDFNVTVAEDAVAAADQIEHLHRASLETMRSYFAQVMPVAAIAAAWPVAKRGAA